MDHLPLDRLRKLHFLEDPGLQYLLDYRDIHHVLLKCCLLGGILDISDTCCTLPDTAQEGYGLSNTIQSAQSTQFNDLSEDEETDWDQVLHNYGFTEGAELASSSLVDLEVEQGRCGDVNGCCCFACQQTESRDCTCRQSSRNCGSDPASDCRTDSGYTRGHLTRQSEQGEADLCVGVELSVDVDGETSDTPNSTEASIVCGNNVNPNSGSQLDTQAVNDSRHARRVLILPKSESSNSCDSKESPTSPLNVANESSSNRQPQTLNSANFSILPSQNCKTQLGDTKPSDNPSTNGRVTRMMEAVAMTTEAVDRKEEEEQMPVSDKKLFVANIPYSATQRELWSFFDKKFGKVTFCQVLYKRSGVRSQRHRGLGFVTFADASDAKRALEAYEEDLFFKNRVLQVEPAKPKPKEKTPAHMLFCQPQGTTAVPGTGEGNHGNPDKPAVTMASKETTSYSGQDEEGLCIDAVNDDVLLLIFSYLTLKEQLLVERVCKRWRLLLLSMWSKRRELKSVEFDCYITDSMLSRVLSKGCSSLTTLDFTHNSRFLTDRALDAIGKHCPNLRKLQLFKISASNSSLKKLCQKCSNLQCVNLRCCESFGEDGLWWLFHLCKDLEYVNIEENCRISGKCFYVLGRNVKAMVISECRKIQDVGIENMAARSPGLTELHMSHCVKVTDRAIQLLGEKCRELRILHMSGNLPHVTRNGLEGLCGLTRLEVLSCADNAAVDDQFLHLLTRQCTLLRELDISHCEAVCDSGVMALAHLPHLVELNISYLRQVSPAGLAPMFSCGRLQRLTAKGCQHLDDACVHTLLVHSPSLVQADLSGCDQVTSESLAVLKCPEGLGRKEGLPLKLVLGGTFIEKEDIDWPGKPNHVQLLLSDFCDYLRRGGPFHCPENYFAEDMYSDDEGEDDIEEGAFAEYAVESGQAMYPALSEGAAEAYLDNDDPLAAEEWELS